MNQTQNQNQIKRTKIGTFMYNLTMQCGWFLDKHIWLYYILNFTWGIFLTVIGFLLALVMLITGHKPKKFHSTFYFNTRAKNWGGLEMGMTFLVSRNDHAHTVMHELGHTYQNAIFGPFMLFLVSIPSAIRYWVRRFKKSEKSYDAIWFEGAASDLGEAVMNYED